jgi:hypothetical protein
MAGVDPSRAQLISMVARQMRHSAHKLNNQSSNLGFGASARFSSTRKFDNQS